MNPGCACGIQASEQAVQIRPATACLIGACGKAGAQILRPPADHPFGERQYTAVDIGGHRWTFSQTIADVDPASWGGLVPKG